MCPKSRKRMCTFAEELPRGNKSVLLFGIFNYKLSIEKNGLGALLKQLHFACKLYNPK